jgi:two-component system, cell cycle sensor histidine kinase and response regulator CckA
MTGKPGSDKMCQRYGTPMVDKTKNILVVDDDPALIQLIAKALRTPEFHIYTAKDGVEALRMIDDPSTVIDLLLVDVVMPRLNGPELVRVVLSHYPEIKIIFMSGFLNEVRDKYGVSVSKLRYLEKPFTFAVLEQAIREELSK